MDMRHPRPAAFAERANCLEWAALTAICDARAALAPSPPSPAPLGDEASRRACLVAVVLGLGDWRGAATSIGGAFARPARTE